MTLFQLKWLRRFVRRNSMPIAQNKAEIWKQRLSIAYAVLAWHAVGIIGYMMYTGRGDWAKHYGLKSEEEAMLSPAQYFSTKLNVERGKILRFSGLNLVGESTFDNTKNPEEKTSED